MTAARLPPLWIADQVRNDGFGVQGGNDGEWRGGMTEVKWE